MVIARQQRQRVKAILDQLNLIEFSIKTEDILKWKCHVCFYERIDEKDYDVNILHFEDGSHIELCDKCFELCKKATLVKDCLAPKLGVICSEKYAELIRMEHAN
jgi:hypothetical protein